ncbi:MAG: hypothetical protein AAF702_29155 [Chloroflexota bacterium]
MTKLIPPLFVTLLLSVVVAMVGLLATVDTAKVAAQDAQTGFTPGPAPSRVTSQPTRNVPTGIPVTATRRPTLTPTPTAVPTVPTACLNKKGEPVVPRIEGNARALVLNFEHAPNGTHSEACKITRNPSSYDPEGVLIGNTEYKVEQCDIIGNPAPSAVGDGMARFDGTFHIECNKYFAAGGESMANFYVYALAQFHHANSSVYSVVDHPDLKVEVTVDNNWNLALRSRYGDVAAPIFTHGDPATNVQNMAVPLLSRIHGDINGTVTGNHAINKTWRLPPASVAPFKLGDGSIEISRSNGGPSWDLHILIIDPPNTYGS